jgi:phenylpropionate dioxygenase-like ring-hydroxylating dioxygenase large terminal subunit
MLQLVFPNVWQNQISEKVRIVVAFVPVDENNTTLYLRFYQKFLTVPILGKWVSILAMPFNLRILNQDKRVVLTQLPAKTDLYMKENLFQADLPIILFRKYRHEQGAEAFGS